MTITAINYRPRLVTRTLLSFNFSHLRQEPTTLHIQMKQLVQNPILQQLSYTVCTVYEKLLQ